MNIEKIKKEVFCRIKELRLKQRMSQSEVAKKAGLHVRSYQRIERSPQNLTLENMIRIAHALGVDVQNLLSSTTFRDKEVQIVGRGFKNSDEALEYAISILKCFQKNEEK